MNFNSERHALYTGFVIGVLAKDRINVRPVVDSDGDYLPEVEITPHDSDDPIILAIPDPPDDWQL